MKLVIQKIIAVSALLCAGSAMAAEEIPAVIKSNNCLLCHQMEGRKAGPGFVDIAKRYKSDPGAGPKLEAKVSKGSAGTWGTMPMPAMNALKSEDIKAMIAYILSTAR